MKKSLLTLMTGLLIVMLAQSCKKDDVVPDEIPEDKIPAEVLATNEWIYENMSLYYFWTTFMPEINRTKEADPFKYFDKLVYEEDRWSYISDDYNKFKSGYEGTPTTMGYQPSFFLAGTKDVFMVVSYVYPGSPAAEAGLERGDIILSVNDAVMDTSNYYDVFSGPNYTVQLGTAVGGQLSFTGESLTLVAREIEADPAIHHEVLDINGHKIGYLVYVEFVSGENDEYLPSLDNIFGEFQAAGATDVIIDLRYNPGGDPVSAAHIASSVAPVSAVETTDVLISMKYNTELQKFLEDNNYVSNLYHRFKATPVNMNLNRIYFFTTGRSASASELLVVGLEPYMDVIQIGEATYGKYAGSWVLPDDDEQWVMLPITFKYANKSGKTDFINGLLPDHAIEDDAFNALPFGDTSDPMMAQAVELITGAPVPGKKAARAEPAIPLRRLQPRQEDPKYNLYDKPASPDIMKKK
jgi:carboxyl-terminal processing protease